MYVGAVFTWHICFGIRIFKKRAFAGCMDSQDRARKACDLESVIVDEESGGCRFMSYVCTVPKFVTGSVNYIDVARDTLNLRSNRTYTSTIHKLACTDVLLFFFAVPYG